MTTEAPDKTASAITFRGIIIDWITEDMRSGKTLQEAAKSTLARLIKTGYADKVLEVIGHEALADIWRKNQREMRHKASNDGVRRVDTARLREAESLSECLFEVGGLWIRVGDLSHEDCTALAAEYGSRAAANAKWEKFFNGIASKLEGGQSVKDRFSEADLQVLMEEATN